MSGFPFDLDPAEKACLGLIVLHVDETIESDFRRIFSDPSVALYVTRIPSGAEAPNFTCAFGFSGAESNQAAP